MRFLVIAGLLAWILLYAAILGIIGAIAYTIFSVLTGITIS